MLRNKILITLATLTYALVVPILELNNTHLFNPDWTPHVRVHELWQLITNSTLGIVSLYLVWSKNKFKLASILGMIITGSFLIAYITRSGYGGSMKFMDGSETTLLGINIGILGFGIAFIIFLVVNIIERNEQL